MPTMSKLSNMPLCKVFIGNPGAGKSSTMNCHAGEALFRSGVSSAGVGMTYQLDVREHNGETLMDTPGLSDIRLRRHAAEAIDQVLQRGGSFQIVFVMTLESGRLKPDDLTTMKLVFDAVGDQIRDDSFSMLINKCSKPFLRKLDPVAWTQTMHEACDERNMRKTRHIHFAPEIRDMVDEDDAICDLDPPTMAFLDNLVRIDIDGALVEKVNADSFDQVMDQMNDLAEKAAEMERALQEEEQRRELAEKANAQTQADLKRTKEQAAIDMKRTKDQALKDIKAAAAAAAEDARKQAKADEDARRAKEEAARQAKVLKPSAYHGGGGGDFFCSPINLTGVREITCRNCDGDDGRKLVSTMHLKFSDGKSFGPGGGCGASKTNTWEVPSGVFITKVEVRASHDFLDGMQFFASDGSASPWFGGGGGSKRVEEAPEGKSLVGVEGRVGGIIDGVKFIWGTVKA